MTNGSCLTDEQLARLGVSRIDDDYGSIYRIPCAICGAPVSNRRFSTNKVYKCKLCKGEVIKRRAEMEKREREEHERALAESIGTDYAHYHRFEKASSKFGEAYARDIEKARKAIDRFDSIPEVMACIELLHIGARVIPQQKVGDYTVDFCLPDEKVAIEIDGSIYHADDDKEYMRDYALRHMLGDGWDVRHIPSDAVSKRHKAFGTMVRRMLDARREGMGMKPLGC